MKIVAVRIGNRYPKAYEDYLESKLPNYDFIWIRQEKDPRIKLQWNKLFAMELEENEPICVIDIDILLINDYHQIFEYPIRPGEFLSIPNWWAADDTGQKINGGFYKYYPKDCSYILETFMQDPIHWQKKYIQAGLTTGPVNGEQNFMQELVETKLDLITVPPAWVTRIDARPTNFQSKSLGFLNARYRKITGNDYLLLGNDFHPDVKLIHFSHMSNIPHHWSKYHLFV